MFGRKRAVITADMKIVGNVTAEGLVEVNGQIEGDIDCTSLVITPKGSIKGVIQAQQVVVNGRVEGPIHGDDVVLKSRADVVGNIQHKSLTIEAGASYQGRLGPTSPHNGKKAPEQARPEPTRPEPSKPDTLSARLAQEMAHNGHDGARGLVAEG